MFRRKVGETKFTEMILGNKYSLQDYERHLKGLIEVNFERQEKVSVLDKLYANQDMLKKSQKVEMVHGRSKKHEKER